jgi:hypothetical protein
VLPAHSFCNVDSLPQFTQDQLGAVIVLNPSSVDDHFQQVAYRINNDMALAAIDSLVCVIAWFTAA